MEALYTVCNDINGDVFTVRASSPYRAKLAAYAGFQRADVQCDVARLTVVRVRRVTRASR